MKQSRRFSSICPYWKGYVKAASHMQMSCSRARPTIPGNQPKHNLPPSDLQIKHPFINSDNIQDSHSTSPWKRKIIKKQNFPSWFGFERSERDLEYFLYFCTQRRRGEFHFVSL